MATFELGPNQLRWIEALESGEYEQGCEGHLCKNAAYCCLGVACDLFGAVIGEITKDDVPVVTFDDDWQFAPSRITTALALKSSRGNSALPIRPTDGNAEWRTFDDLVDANDEGVTFAEIAAFCRANPDAVFTESR